MASNGLGSEEEKPLADTKPEGLSHAEVSKLCKDVLDNIIGTNAYSYGDSTVWNQKVVERITGELVSLNRPFKYIVTSALLQTTNGSGLNVSSVSYWNKQTDISFSIRWENKHMLAVVNVFAVAF